MAHQQIHDKFKIFTGPLAADKTIGPLADQIAAFVTEHKVAAKSIGVEYVESRKQLLITLGYREDETTYPVKVTTVSLGKIGDLDGVDATRLEAAMAKAAGTVQNILCHELYITEEGDFLMILMSYAGQGKAY